MERLRRNNGLKLFEFDQELLKKYPNVELKKFLQEREQPSNEILSESKFESKYSSLLDTIKTYA